jgi:NADPH-dependent glutamate synthase beta subunit-like oxidoreductase
MGRPTGFLEHAREPAPTVEPRVRLRTFAEVQLEAPAEHLAHQASRCMDCGVPFCQSDTGCPLHNVVPEWNDLVYRGRFREALDRLHATNNFPEVTGRVCPAPCEGACVLAVNDAPVTIRNIEQARFRRGLDRPRAAGRA